MRQSPNLSDVIAFQVKAQNLSTSLRREVIALGEAVNLLYVFVAQVETGTGVAWRQQERLIVDYGGTQRVKRLLWVFVGNCTAQVWGSGPLVCFLVYHSRGEVKVLWGDGASISLSWPRYR